MYKLKKVLGITAALTAIPWILQFAFHHFLLIALLLIIISCVCFVGFLIVSAVEKFILESLSSYCDEKFEPKHKEDKK